MIRKLSSNQIESNWMKRENVTCDSLFDCVRSYKLSFKQIFIDRTEFVFTNWLFIRFTQLWSTDGWKRSNDILNWLASVWKLPPINSKSQMESDDFLTFSEDYRVLSTEHTYMAHMGNDIPMSPVAGKLLLLLNKSSLSIDFWKVLNKSY